MPGLACTEAREAAPQQPYVEEDNIIGEYLFENNPTEETKATIWKIWMIKEKGAKEKRKMTDSDSREIYQVEALQRQNSRPTTELS